MYTTDNGNTMRTIVKRWDGERATFEDVITNYDPLDWHTAGLSKTATGYGTKIETPYTVNYEGRRRIYADIKGNVASTYIMVNNKKVFMAKRRNARQWRRAIQIRRRDPQGRSHTPPANAEGADRKLAIVQTLTRASPPPRQAHGSD